MTAKKQDAVASIPIVSVHMSIPFFFKLWYKVSERGISLLLAFLRGLLSWLGTSGHSAHIHVLELHDLIPKNI